MKRVVQCIVIIITFPLWVPSLVLGAVFSVVNYGFTGKWVWLHPWKEN